MQSYHRHGRQQGDSGTRETMRWPPCHNQPEGRPGRKLLTGPPMGQRLAG